MQPIDPLPGDYRPPITDNPADVLARVYALILSWPTGDARPTEGDGTVTERSNER